MLVELTNYLEKVDQVGAEYLNKVEYSPKRKKILEMFVVKQLKKWKLQGKKVNSNLLFGLYMVAAEVKLGSDLYELTKQIPKINIIETR